MAFTIKAAMISKATAYKSALYRVEYAEGVETNVYAASRKEALARLLALTEKELT